MNRCFPICDICGALAHKANSCPLGPLEARRDPFGEEARRRSRRRGEYRRTGSSSETPDYQGVKIESFSHPVIDFQT